MPHFFLRSIVPCLPEAALAYLEAMLRLELANSIGLKDHDDRRLGRHPLR